MPTNQSIQIDNQEFQLDTQNETIWADAKKIASIFDCTVDNVYLHAKNIILDKELTEESSVHKKNGYKLYSLDMIIAIGYRVKSKNATQFRIKATKILKEYLTTGEVKRNLPQIDSKFLLQIAEEMQKKEILISEQQSKIEIQDNTIYEISNTQDSYSLRECKNRLMCKEDQLKHYLKIKKWIQYLSDGVEGKKMYSTSYSKENGFATDKAVLNKARQHYFHQFRITKRGMDYLIKHRQDIISI